MKKVFFMITLICGILVADNTKLSPQEMMEDDSEVSLKRMECSDEKVKMELENLINQSMDISMDDEMIKDYEIAIQRTKKLKGDLQVCAAFIKHTISLDASSLGIMEDSKLWEMAVEMAIVAIKDELEKYNYPLNVTKDSDNNLIIYQYLQYLPYIDDNGKITIFSTQF